MDYQKELDYIMDTFDFKRVEEVMHHLKWNWVSTDNMPPEEYDLRQQARQLLGQAHEMSVQYNDYFAISTGGFKAVCDVEHDQLSLLFILESAGDM